MGRAEDPWPVGRQDAWLTAKAPRPKCIALACGCQDSLAHEAVVIGLALRLSDIQFGFGVGADEGSEKRRGREKSMKNLQGIESKFRFILVAAQRAHQLRDGSKARVQSESNKVTVVAQREVSSGLVPFEIKIAHRDGHD